MADLGIPREIILDIRKGRYAVDPKGNGKLLFIRVSERKNPKSNLFQHIVFQSQHSDMLTTRAVFTPEGDLRTTYWSVESLTDVILSIITDPWSAAIRYGRELGQCCRCGKTLTDGRSRWYGIGPECEVYWPEVIAEVQAEHGGFMELEREMMS